MQLLNNSAVDGDGSSDSNEGEDVSASHQSEWVDYLRPIIADGDTGHGGITAVMKLTKLLIEAGAAGIHFEDQKPGQFNTALSSALDHYRHHEAHTG